MQIFLSIVLCILLISNFILYIRTGKLKNKEKIHRLRLTTFAVELIIISELFILWVRNRNMTFMMFIVFYIGLLWLLFFIVRFSIAYAGFKKIKHYKSVYFWITVITSGLLLLDYFAKRLFTLTHVRWLGHAMWSARKFTWFYSYVFICILFLISAIVILMYATFKSAKLYRLKYTIIIGLIISISIGYFYVQVKEIPLVVSVISFGIAELVFIYMAAYYAPRRLVNTALVFVADKLNDGVVLYDDDHNLQFVTDSFIQAFDVDNISKLDNEFEYWKNILNDYNSDRIFTGQIKSVVKNDVRKYYEIHHNSFDEDGKSVGTVYWILDVTDSVENYEKMIFRANYDELTGIYNEAHFYEVASELINNNTDKTFVMLCSNVDKFRVFSDLFGKERAQELLIKTANSLKTNMKNIPLCRYGKLYEDCFFIIMPKESFYPEDMIRKVDEITESFCSNNYKLLVKLGVYEITDITLNMHSICNRAAMACEFSKIDYQHRIVWFDENVQNESILMERFNAELTAAIENEDIKMYLQPQTDNAGTVIGAEALARWEHKEYGLVPPAKFIPLFENNGRITELDIYIWEQACKKLSEWKNAGFNDMHISVNISARDLYAINIYEHFKQLIKKYDIDSRMLKLEITESAIINDLEQHISLINNLKEIGFEIEMDDFGSAYSSFNMLKDIYVNVLKIDMKFLGETHDLSRSQIILKSIIDLSKKLGIKTVAEGVENVEQFEFLKNAGCDIYQGYYFAKPMPVERFEEKYVK